LVDGWVAVDVGVGTGGLGGADGVVVLANAVIVKTESANRSKRGPLRDLPEADVGTIDSTQIFFERFKKSLEDVLTSSRDAMTLAVNDWIGDRNAALGGLRTQLAEPRLLELLARGEKALSLLGRGNTDLIRPLRVLVDLDWARDVLADLIEDEAVTDEQLAERFPLPRPRYLPWHRAMPTEDGDVERILVRHQTYMFRMRREIAAAMADTVASRLAQDVTEFRRDLLGSLNLGMDLIPDPGTVRTMFPDPAKAKQEETTAADATGSPVRSLLREWRARNA
jgi:hypothetical protein